MVANEVFKNYIWRMDLHLLCFIVNYIHNSLCCSSCPKLASGKLLILAPASFWQPPPPATDFWVLPGSLYKFYKFHFLNSLAHIGIGHVSLVHFRRGWYLETIWYNSMFQDEVSVDNTRHYIFKKIWRHLVSDSNFKLQRI